MTGVQTCALPIYRNKISKSRDPYGIPIGIKIVSLLWPLNTILVECPVRKD